MQNNNLKFKIIKYLGVDWGEKRIGLAIGDSETKIAIPFKVVQNMDELIKVIETEKIDQIIVGQPLSIANYKLQITNEKYIEFIKDLKSKTNLLIKLIDERLSSKAADALVGNKKTKAPRDTVAAMLILQSYLDKMLYGKDL
ncbi:Holliday junction resolvase RuvX [Patescibacteria group bacterium]|nr:Holliday junction resolvase RuvX [Patescibacteria group bacterium]MBU1871093.1 Holliday junction resolvase RuvX [Patescibacteria group bacterium]